MNILELTQKHGATVLPYLLGTGLQFYPDNSVWFVNSEHDNAADYSDGDHGERFDLPLASIFGSTGAVYQASAGDLILVAPGHIEPIWGDATKSIAIGKDGLAIIGMTSGAGWDRPVIGFSHASSKIAVKSGNILMQNLNFQSQITSVAVGIELDYSGALGVTGNATGFKMIDCIVTDDASGDEFTKFISIDATVNDVTIDNLKYIANNTTSSVIFTVGAISNLTVKNCDFRGGFGVAAIDGDAAKITNLTLLDNILQGVTKGITLHATTTGIAARNFATGGTSTANIFADTSALWCFENYVSDDAGASGILTPVAAAADA